MATRADGLSRARLVTKALTAASVAGVVAVGAVVAQQHKATATSPAGTSTQQPPTQQGGDDGAEFGDDGNQQLQQVPVQPAPQGSGHHAVTSGS